MKKVIPIILLAIIIPQAAFAAWWNPLSWFKKQSIDQEKAELLERLVGLEEKVNSQEVATSTAQEESVKSEIREKIITQTITVDNPDLQKRINDLIEENISLQAKVISQASLVGQLNSCKADLVETRAMVGKTVVNSAEEEKKQKLEALDQEMLTLVQESIVDMENTVKGYGGWGSVVYKDLQSMKSRVSSNIDQILGLIYSYTRVDPAHSKLSISKGVDDPTKTLAELRTLLKDLEFYITYR